MTIHQWSVRPPGRSERDRTFEAEGAALVSAAMHAGKADPAVVTYPNGARYLVYVFDDTIEYTTRVPGATTRHVVEP